MIGYQQPRALLFSFLFNCCSFRQQEGCPLNLALSAALANIDKPAPTADRLNQVTGMICKCLVPYLRIIVNILMLDTMMTDHDKAFPPADYCNGVMFSGHNHDPG